ncbi:hypothetical protein BJX64DRAFT_163697 [Aspergillus heterothallicus]
MARDCPDRQRGSDWRNNQGGFAGRRAIGSGDAVDREMEQLMQELSGGGPGPDGQPPRRIEAGPDQGYDDRDMKPWQRPPPQGDVAPWQQRAPRDSRRDDYAPRDNNSAAPWASQGLGGNDYGYGAPGDYGAPGAAAPWQQQAAPAAPGQAAPGQAAYGYGGYPSYPPPAPGMGAPGAPPGLGAPPPPPGISSMYYGAGASPPPPPPGEGPPPPVCYS